MKAGDLRRFKDSAPPSARSAAELGATRTCPGRTFVVLSVLGRVPGYHSGQVEVLIDGVVAGPWGYPWVEHNSEVINEG